MKGAFLDGGFEIPWSRLVPSRVEPEISGAIEAAQERIDAIGRKRPLTFENTFLALEKATETLEVAWQKVSHLNSVNNSPELRQAYNEMLPRVTEFWARIPLNDFLWSALKAFAQSEAAGDLNPVERRFLEETMADFREYGSDLPPGKKGRFEAVSRVLAQATQKFSENVLDSTNRFELIVDQEKRLAGLPQLAREQARQEALKHGQGTVECPRWRFTQQMPSYLPAMKYLKDDDIRRRLWEGAGEIGRVEPHDNTSLVWKILGLREERARLLGKSSFADLVLARRMAKSSDRALEFVDELFSRVKELFDRECVELEEFVAEKTGRATEPLEPWAMAYWAEVMRRENYHFDEEELRPYFPIDGVIEGMFRIAETLFGVEIRERATVFSPGVDSEVSEMAEKGDQMGVEVWHPEVRYYEVYGGKGMRLGAFYTDWHPRESKRSGAWMNSLITGGPTRGVDGGERRPHLGLICGNLTPSVGDRVSLLTHREVETIFHEFGHLLHHLLGEVEIRSLNGIHVPWDFVELPSQIMENWCWERESLDLFACHYETGDPIPEELFAKMIRSRNFHSATLMMRQLSLGKMDLELHTHFRNFAGRDLDESLDRVLSGFRPPSKTKPFPMVRRFGHLFSSSTGYAAGYYSYKWSEVLDADAFTRFRKEGILNPRVGREFADKILSRGNSAEPDQLYRNFMGRGPDLEALLRRAGLSPRN